MVKIPRFHYRGCGSIPAQGTKIPQAMQLSRGKKRGAGVDLEIIMLIEVNQKEKDKYHIISLICGI